MPSQAVRARWQFSRLGSTHASHKRSLAQRLKPGVIFRPGAWFAVHGGGASAVRDGPDRVGRVTPDEAAHAPEFEGTSSARPGRWSDGSLAFWRQPAQAPRPSEIRLLCGGALITTLGRLV